MGTWLLPSCSSIVLRAGLANFFRVNISILKAIIVSVPHLGSAVVAQKLRNQYLNEWTWLCFNKALFIIIDSEPDVVY